MALLTFSNAERYRVHGPRIVDPLRCRLLLADLSATYYLKTETCDPAFAAQRCARAAGRGRSTQDTPDCTPGSFMGSYATQNPPGWLST